jgi:hypothetical protein
LHRSLADTSGVRRYQRFGGVQMVGHLRGEGRDKRRPVDGRESATPSVCRSGSYADGAPRL